MDRLTKLIKPKKIYMGEKDFQQLYLVKKYIKKGPKTKIISCKTIRDASRLAFSSRNKLLKKSELNMAKKISNELFLLKKKLVNDRNSKKLISEKKNQLTYFYDIKFDYLELINISTFKNSNTTKNSKLFVAYYINNVRLIDNF